MTETCQANPNSLHERRALSLLEAVLGMAAEGRAAKTASNCHASRPIRASFDPSYLERSPVI